MLMNISLLLFLVAVSPLVVTFMVNTLDWLMARRLNMAFNIANVTQESLRVLGFSYLLFASLASVQVLLIFALYKGAI